MKYLEITVFAFCLGSILGYFCREITMPEDPRAATWDSFRACSTNLTAKSPGYAFQECEFDAMIDGIKATLKY